MFQPRSIQSSLNFKDKLLSIDYVLVVSILILGIVSMFAMYSTDGGEFKYHTQSHILRFFVFFFMFLTLSFVSIRFWHSTSFLIYFIFFILLFIYLIIISHNHFERMSIYILLVGNLHYPVIFYMTMVFILPIFIFKVIANTNSEKEIYQSAARPL